MRTKNRRAEMGTWFLVVVLLISSTASSENVTGCVLKDPGMHFISLGNRTVLKVGENANVSCKFGYQIVPNIYSKPAYEYEYPDSESTADPSEMPETEDNATLVSVKDGNYTCRDNGKWEPEIRFSCKQIICDSFYGYNLENGHIFYSSRYAYTVGTVASFRCNPGYIRHGPDNRTCQIDGTWSGECVTCQRIIRNPSITCPAPCVPDGARKTGSHTYEIGSRVDFHCPRSKTQDRRDRSRSKYCIKNGEYASWNGTSINCKKIICDKGDHYGFENGKVTYSSSIPTVGTKAVFMCNPGYNQRGPMTRICQKDGTWSRGCVTCQKHQHNWSTCPAPCVPDGAKRIGSLSYELGSIIQFYCFQFNVLYKVESRYIRHCVNDGKSASWNGTNINCKAKCEPLTDTYKVVQNGVVPGILSDKTVVELSCSRSLAPVLAECRNGHWYPTCEDRCFIEPTVNLEYFIGHEKVLENYIHSGILMHARCSNRMELFRLSSYLEREQVSVKCYLGKLEPASLVCKDKRCNITITPIENGHFRNRGNVIVAREKIHSGSTIQLQCYAGYELYNQTNSMYLELEHTDIKCYQGSFIPETPSCEPKRCNITITRIENGHFRNGGNEIVAGEKIHSGSNIQLLCYAGYELYNKTNSMYLELEHTDIKCYQGSFIPETPSCEPKRCNITITRIENGHFRNGGNESVAGEKIHSGSNIQLLCYAGYELYNKTNSMYLELEHTDIKCYQGSFIPETPSCEPKRCNITITRIENGHFRNGGNEIVAGEKVHSGSNIQLQCYDGYELYNKTNSMYLELEHTDIKCYQGSFIPETPSCEPKRCNITITRIENGHFRNGGNEIVAGEKVHSGSNIQLQCYDGYELYNKTNSMYLELEHTDIKCYQGSFIPETPSCEPKRCNITITRIENGHFRNGGNEIVAGDKIHSGSNITLECFDGYELFNESISKFLGSEKTDILCYQGSFTVAFPKCKLRRKMSEGLLLAETLENLKNRADQNFKEWEKINSGMARGRTIDIYNSLRLYLLVDSSGSITDATFEIMKQFLKILLEKVFGGRKDNTRTDVFLQFFGSKLSEEFTFKTLSEFQNLNITRSNATFWTKGGTNIQTALRGMVTEIQTKELTDMNQNYDPKRVLIVISDGQNNMGGDIEQDLIKELHFEAETYSIFVGKQESERQNIDKRGFQLMNKLASKNKNLQDEHFFSIVLNNSTEGLKSVIDQMTNITDPIQCGEFSELTKLNQQGEIDTMKNALDGAWPWMVNLENELNIHQCGATLLNENWILTAAHCEIKPGWKIYIGRLDRSDTGANFIETSMAKTIRHNKYNDRTFLYNIRLVKLANPVFYNTKKPYAVPVCLYNATEFPELNYEDLFKPKSRGVVTGWEKQINDGRFPATLKQLQLPILNDAICQEFAAKNTQQTFNASVNFCALRKGADKTVDACEGNSGGPFVVKVDKLDSSKRRKAVFIQIGIVSWGFKCGIYMPDYYVRLTPEIIKWINDQISEK